MKKIRWIVLILAMFLMVCLSSNAAENLSDWDEYIEQGDVQFTVSGSTVSVSGAGSIDDWAWGSLSKYFEHASGITATINVSSYSGDESGIRLRKYIGTTSSGNRILAEVSVSQYKGDHRMYFRVRERLTDGTTVEELANGVLGHWRNMWEMNEDVTVGMGVIGNDICFYTSKIDAVTKVKLDLPLSSIERSIEITSGPAAGSAVSGTVKDVTILYADDMKVFSDAASVNNGYLATSDLWIKAVIEADGGDINAVFNKSGEKVTSSGATVVYGHFFANPSDVSWGDGANPDLYVKIWFDPSGRIDVNYFHVSVPDIVVYSDYPYDGSYDQTGTTTMDNRYIRHEFTKQ